MKALALLSGGLDSMLSVKLMQEQGIEVEGVNFHTGFCSCGDKAPPQTTSGNGQAGKACKHGAQGMADQLNIKLHRMNITQEYIKEVVINPKHGYGSQMNPCLDCRAFMLKKAKDMMSEVGAAFLISGEVLNQRPMTQHLHQMELTESEAGVAGLVVRPLTAQNLPPSFPERQGWVKRESLMAMKGRGRKDQLKLVKEKGIESFEQPSGGCLLTDEAFSRKLRDLFAHEGKDALNVREIMLLKMGRHFRLPSGARCIVGRRQEENTRLALFRRADEALCDTLDIMGPHTIVRGSERTEDLHDAARLTARYSDADKSQPVTVRIRLRETDQQLSVTAMADAELEPLRI